MLRDTPSLSLGFMSCWFPCTGLQAHLTRSFRLHSVQDKDTRCCLLDSNLAAGETTLPRG
jgi:hypothetical protein